MDAPARAGQARRDRGSDGDALRGQLLIDYEAARLHLREVVDRYGDPGWRREHKGFGVYPEGHLWWAAKGFLELEAARATRTDERASTAGSVRAPRPELSIRARCSVWIPIRRLLRAAATTPACHAKTPTLTVWRRGESSRTPRLIWLVPAGRSGSNTP